jgi:hypothetical protein
MHVRKVLTLAGLVASLAAFSGCGNDRDREEQESDDTYRSGGMSEEGVSDEGSFDQPSENDASLGGGAGNDVGGAGGDVGSQTPGTEGEATGSGTTDTGGR